MRSKTNLKLIQDLYLGDYKADVYTESEVECIAIMDMEQEELRHELYGFVSLYLLKLSWKREQILN